MSTYDRKCRHLYSTRPVQREPETKRASRDGKKMIAGFFDPSVSRELNMLAAQQDTTVQALLAEAIDLLFEKRGCRPVA